MQYVRADSGWIGLLVFVGAIVFQLFAALRKGQAARPPIPGTTQRRAPAPVVRRPVPIPAPAPWRPEPVFVPQPPQREAEPAPLPPKLRELFEELSAPPEAVLPPPPAPVSTADRMREIDAATAAAQAMETAERAGATSAAAPAAWSRLRAQGRADWQRAFLLSEILQPPVALRPDGFSRSAHV